MAHALARKVLPVPGGPYNNIPFHGFLLPVNTYGNLIGITTAYFNEFFAFYNPDTSYHFTFGFYVTIASASCPFNPVNYWLLPPCCGFWWCWFGTIFLLLVLPVFWYVYGSTVADLSLYLPLSSLNFYS